MSDVSTPSPAVERMRARIRLPRTLMGGTQAMRAAAQIYLPQEPAESTRAYRNRLNRSVLFNAFARTIAGLVGKVFRRPIGLGADMPEPVRALVEDVDLAGRHLDVFGRDVLQAALVDGLTHILVDYPTTEPGLTLADERALRLRPYFVHIRADQLIGFRTEHQAGRDVVTHVRYAESVTEPEGRFGEREVTQIRVIEPGRFEVWRQDDQGQWFVHDEGPTSMPEVPWVTIYAGARIGPFEAEPPLLDLAHLNVAHWQSASDQRHILHVARVPILFGSGFNDENEPDIFEIGPNRAITGPTGADLKYVEHSGAAMEAGRQDLLDLEARMAVVGADLLLKRPGVMTATQRILDEGAADSQLAAIALEFQDGLERAFGFAARWMGFGGDAGGSLSVNREFGTHLRDPSELDLLLRARLNGDISHETFVRELIRRGVLPEDIDPADEVERAESDMPPRPRDAPVPAH